MYILSRDNIAREIALDEFWNDLAEVNELKISDHAKKHLLVFKDKSNFLAHSPLVFSEEKVEEIRAKRNSAKRKKLEQRWSFTELLTQLKNHYKGEFGEKLLGLNHTYRIASHISHGDETGIGIINEREGRSNVERENACIEHFLRLMSDCYSFSQIIALKVMDMLGRDRSIFLEIRKSLDSISEIEAKYKNRVFEDPDYDKYKENFNSKT